MKEEQVHGVGSPPEKKLIMLLGSSENGNGAGEVNGIRDQGQIGQMAVAMAFPINVCPFLLQMYCSDYSRTG